MIVTCDECESEFNLEESLIKEEGSKVRCSVCKHVFTVYRQEPEAVEEVARGDIPDEDLEETVALDSPPDFEESDVEPSEEAMGDAFDTAFEEALKEDSIQDVSQDDALEPEEVADKIAPLDEDEREDIRELVEEEPDEDIGMPAEPSSKRKQGRSRVLLIAILIVLVLIMGAVSVYLWAPQILPDSLSSLKPVEEDILDKGVRRLNFKDVSGSFIQTRKAGQLFVIKGTVVNNNPKSRSFILVKGSILDDKGKVIRRKIVYAGNTFKEDQLKDMPMEMIDKRLKDRFGKDKTNFNVKPGGAVPFMIIFENLPDNLSEFIVEAVSSSPGE